MILSENGNYLADVPKSKIYTVQTQDSSQKLDCGEVTPEMISVGVDVLVDQMIMFSIFEMDDKEQKDLVRDIYLEMAARSPSKACISSDSDLKSS